jgi:2-polyprenyl-3-methyl-5-hydroxy-6-metoxy-1,4-benzoquinol methylase
MGERYWDSMAEDFDGEIFDTLANDRGRVIVKTIRQFGSSGLTACDFGCGVGRYLPILAEMFERVYAVDFSGKCLEQAKSSCEELTNIVYEKRNLASSAPKIRNARLGLSVNVLTMPSHEERTAILQNILPCLSESGHLILIVPSMESALYSHFRLSDWKRRSSIAEDCLATQRLTANDSSLFSVANGVLNVEGVPTKHYLEEELRVWLASTGFKIDLVDKVEYSWQTEFSKPPRWMKAPYPWDWLVACQRV